MLFSVPLKKSTVNFFIKQSLACCHLILKKEKNAVLQHRALWSIRHKFWTCSLSLFPISKAIGLLLRGLVKESQELYITSPKLTNLRIRLIWLGSQLIIITRIKAPSIKVLPNSKLGLFTHMLKITSFLYTREQCTDLLLIPAPIF